MRSAERLPLEGKLSPQVTDEVNALRFALSRGCRKTKRYCSEQPFRLGHSSEPPPLAQGRLFSHSILYNLYLMRNGSGILFQSRCGGCSGAIFRRVFLCFALFCMDASAGLSPRAPLPHGREKGSPQSLRFVVIA